MIIFFHTCCYYSDTWYFIEFANILHSIYVSIILSHMIKYYHMSHTLFVVISESNVLGPGRFTGLCAKMFGPRSMWSECTVRISFLTETGHFIVEPPCENWGGPRSQWLKPSRWGEDTVAGRGFGLKPIRDRILVTFIDIHSVACHYFWWWLAFAKTDLIDVCSGLVFNRSVRAMYPWPNIYSWWCFQARLWSVQVVLHNPAFRSCWTHQTLSFANAGC